ncbi:MAG: co-chaperone GroES family protein [Bacteroidota bacterium]|nr:co-chaperone GroES family protein [Bacteroidota bacterium]MDE2834328.1 co-chaperone GroES family protein [Bacteroidota bacterium]MDE2957141.1 co-chaperone GroES family protein [Bacteroidota bacterium]
MPELIVVGDRVLVEPDEGDRQTDSGLLLPASVAERESVGSGRIVRVGPGHLIPNPEYTEEEPWSKPKQLGRYLPLQASPGDHAYFVRKESIEFLYHQKKYLVMPHHAILVLVRQAREDVLSELLDESSR